MKAETMKKWLQEISGDIDAIVARIRATEYRAQTIRELSAQNPYLAMLTSIKGSLLNPSLKANSMLANLPAIERTERIAAVFENLYIDLGEESLKALELLDSERRYQYERDTLSGKIQSAIFDICNQECERLRDAAYTDLIAAGFVDPCRDNTWILGCDSVIVKPDFNHDLNAFMWSLDRNGVTVDSGTSGDFPRLLSAISPVAQEVKS